MMEMHAEQIIALLITGLGVGFASGLLGVGGCFIMVLVQFWVLKSIGIDPTIAIRIAFGTNLLVVLPTAFSGAMTHHKKGAVLWNEKAVPVNADECLGCESCIEVCEQGAITVTEI